MSTAYAGTGGNGDADGEPEKRSRFSWAGWEARVAADPQFIYKVLVEQARSPHCPLALQILWI